MSVIQKRSSVNLQKIENKISNSAIDDKNNHHIDWVAKRIILIIITLKNAVRFSFNYTLSVWFLDLLEKNPTSFHVSNFDSLLKRNTNFDFRNYSSSDNKYDKYSENSWEQTASAFSCVELSIFPLPYILQPLKFASFIFKSQKLFFPAGLQWWEDGTYVTTSQELFFDFGSSLSLNYNLKSNVSIRKLKLKNN